MSAFSISMMVELVVGVLLVATIAYCFVLDRRLKALRDGEGELRKIIVALDKATTRAQGAVTELRVSCDGLTRDMDRDLKKARALADELGPEGIRVNALLPGWIDTPFNNGFWDHQDDAAEARRKIEAGIPMRRHGSADEVAGTVQYPASPAARYVTGTALVVDGGYTAV